MKLVLLLLAVVFFRLWRLGVPSAYVFDEVYHVFTSQEMTKGNAMAWEWWNTPPAGVAYEWTHPPLIKLAIAAFIKVFGDHSFAWRLAPALFGVLAVTAVYYFARRLFKKEPIALLAAFFFGFDGLSLTMSRTGMADTAIAFFTTASLACFYNYLKQKKLIHYSLLLTGIFTGLNLATKWSGSLTYLIYAVFLLARLIKYLKQPKAILFVIYCLVFVPLAIYFLMFLPFFTSGHTLTQWWELQRQMYYYHSHLKATHAYQSMAWQWPLLLRPVWFYVDYAKTAVANIYNLGNPAIFWGGLISLLFCRNLFLLASYLLLFFPLVFSPRIMFLHHYLPALAILCLILANVVSRLPKKYITFIIVITVITFIFFYPINSAVPLPSNLVKYWFWLPGWR